MNESDALLANDAYNLLFGNANQKKKKKIPSKKTNNIQIKQTKQNDENNISINKANNTQNNKVEIDENKIKLSLEKYKVKKINNNENSKFINKKRNNENHTIEYKNSEGNNIFTRSDTEI